MGADVFAEGDRVRWIPDPFNVGTVDRVSRQLIQVQWDGGGYNYHRPVDLIKIEPTPVPDLLSELIAQWCASSQTEPPVDRLREFAQQWEQRRDHSLITNALASALAGYSPRGWRWTADRTLAGHHRG